MTNTYLTRAEYDVFRQLPGRRIVKCAWLGNAGGRQYVINAFEESLAGLILAETEFATTRSSGNRAHTAAV